MAALYWWAYVHKNGEVIVKRFFDEMTLTEADASPFVVRRTGEFLAATKEEAERQAKKILGV